MHALTGLATARSVAITRRGGASLRVTYLFDRARLAEDGMLVVNGRRGAARWQHAHGELRCTYLTGPEDRAECVGIREERVPSA
jgi:hypothetical protein